MGLWVIIMKGNVSSCLTSTAVDSGVMGVRGDHSTRLLPSSPCSLPTPLRLGLSLADAEPQDTRFRFESFSCIRSP